MIANDCLMQRINVLTLVSQLKQVALDCATLQRLESIGGGHRPFETRPSEMHCIVDPAKLKQRQDLAKATRGEPSKVSRTETSWAGLGVPTPCPSGPAPTLSRAKSGIGMDIPFFIHLHMFRLLEF